MTGQAHSSQSGAHNRLLDALVRECPQLTGRLSRRVQKVGTELYGEGSQISEIYFPTRGVVSVVVRLRSGAAADAQTIGNEGMVGLPAWFGLSGSPDTVIQQATGEMVSVAASAFGDAVVHCDAARRILESYAVYSLRFSSQTCVCNAHHSVKERLCRWVLGSVDRAGSDELAMSQALVAEMVGARRQTVGEILVELHRAGIISLRRNHIRVVDRSALLALSCECYETTRATYARLVQPLL
ncbi:Crp/Fnr family transcriptional regulator [Piscinibacter sp. XHJ-5]|uniref:Crp/Fnr family transcriptional regulator n=1 Tax=Piscinibacter sp. XHJ-5 TaxID=3037797 RepID=UPI002452AB3B|nr:Crp/Fnr family transcriptional regulator [Piscinibacter sp. XHJ-5]